MGVTFFCDHVITVCVCVCGLQITQVGMVEAPREAHAHTRGGSVRRFSSISIFLPDVPAHVLIGATARRPTITVTNNRLDQLMEHYDLGKFPHTHTHTHVKHLCGAGTEQDRTGCVGFSDQRVCKRRACVRPDEQWVIPAASNAPPTPTPQSKYPNPEMEASAFKTRTPIPGSFLGVAPSVQMLISVMSGLMCGVLKAPTRFFFFFTRIIIIIIMIMCTFAGTV